MLVINGEIDKSKLVNDKESIFVSFSYNEEAIQKIKGVQGRRYVPETKTWEIPLSELTTLRNIFKDDRVIIKSKKPKVELPENYVFKTQPLEHQKEGIVYGLNHNKFLLGDEQGLGKTFQSLHIAAIRKYLYLDKHTLIICGINGLKSNWLNEIKLHTNESGFILGARYTKKGNPKQIKSADKLADLKNIANIDDYFLITNVESFMKDDFTQTVQSLCTKGIISTILFDEVHCCKNPGSISGENIVKLTPKNFICMTGTPIVNAPLDCYITLRLLGVETSNFWAFKNHYTIFKSITPRGKKKTLKIPIGYKNLENIQQKIKNNYLRRKKEDVLNLPDKLYKTEYLEMLPKQKALYQDIVDNILTDTKIEEIDNPLAMFTRLRQVTSVPSIISEVSESIKMERLKQIVDEKIQNNRKVIVFTNWAEVAKVANRELKQYRPALIIGEIADKNAEINRFKQDKNCGVIIGTLKLLGTGYTLTEADTVIFIDSPWTKALKSQAEDRTHRIGTKYPVNVITLVCKNTVDERVEEIIQNKTDMTNLLLEFKSVGKFIKYMLE